MSKIFRRIISKIKEGIFQKIKKYETIDSNSDSIDSTYISRSNPSHGKSPKNWLVKMDSEPASTLSIDNKSSDNKKFKFKYSNQKEISANWKKLKSQIKSSKRKNQQQTDRDMVKKVQNSQPLAKQIQSCEPTKCVAMDCEMVGTGFNGDNSILARVSIVNQHGQCIYDKYVKPTEKITDYRTDVSGIRPEDLKNAEDFRVVQSEVFQIINNRILVGHSINHDLHCLFLSHPKNLIRDTSRYFKRFQPFNGRRTPSLRKLAELFLGIKIQDGEHDSVIDAQATMQLYNLHRKEWEKCIQRNIRQRSRRRANKK